MSTPFIPQTPFPDFNKVLRDTIVVAGQERLQEEIAQTPWYQKYSNTATTVVSAVSVFAVWSAGNELGLPNWVQMIVGGVLVVAEVLGIKATKNGITEATIPRVINPGTMEAVAAEAEKLLAAQLEAAFRADPNAAPRPYIGDHRAPEITDDLGARYSP